MNFNLDDLIEYIKTYALTNGFTSVDTYKLNLNSNADTLLPKLFIKVSNIDYDKFLNGCAEMTYNLDLIIIVAASEEKPAITIEGLARVLMRQLFSQNLIFNNISLKEEIEFKGFELTDDQSEYSRYGGAFGTLRISIDNTDLI